jgi:hypothetical protein
MTTISLPVNKTVNTVAASLPGYRAVPPQLSGQVYTTNTTSGQFLTSTGINTIWSNTTNEVMRINQTNPPTLEVKGNLVINGVDL